MLKQLRDRLSYALIGFALGAVLAAVLWLLYDAGLSRRANSPEVHAGLVNWVKYVGGFFAVIGFLFKDRVGSAIGGTAREVHDYESYQSSNPEVPRWLAVLALLAVAVGVWYVVH
jgi:hypothetical protein